MELTAWLLGQWVPNILLGQPPKPRPLGPCLVLCSISKEKSCNVVPEDVCRVGWEWARVVEKIFSHIAHVAAAERGKEPGGSHWPFCRLSFDIFVSGLVPRAFFQPCLRTQFTESQLFKRINLCFSAWVEESHFPGCVE